MSNLHLSGRITPKSGSDLDTMGELFTNFLQAKNQTLSVTGESVQPMGSSGPVNWLSTAFKTLTLDVTLPGQSFEVCVIARSSPTLLIVPWAMWLDHPIDRHGRLGGGHDGAERGICAAG